MDAKIVKLTEAIHALVLSKKKKHSSPQAPPHHLKAVEETCVTCGGPHAYYNCTAAEGSPFEVNSVGRSYNQGVTNTVLKLTQTSVLPIKWAHQDFLNPIIQTGSTKAK